MELIPIFPLYRIIGIKDSIIMEIEHDYVNKEDAIRNIPFFEEQYPDYRIEVEEY